MYTGLTRILVVRFRWAKTIGFLGRIPFSGRQGWSFGDEQDAYSTKTSEVADRRWRATGTGADQPLPNEFGAMRGTREDAARLCRWRDDLGDRAVAEHEPAEDNPMYARCT